MIQALPYKILQTELITIISYCDPMNSFDFIHHLKLLNFDFIHHLKLSFTINILFIADTICLRYGTQVLSLKKVFGILKQSVIGTVC